MNGFADCIFVARSPLLEATVVKLRTVLCRKVKTQKTENKQIFQNSSSSSKRSSNKQSSNSSEYNKRNEGNFICNKDNYESGKCNHLQYLDYLESNLETPFEKKIFYELDGENGLIFFQQKTKIFPVHLLDEINILFIARFLLGLSSLDRLCKLYIDI